MNTFWSNTVAASFCGALASLILPGRVFENTRNDYRFTGRDLIFCPTLSSLTVGMFAKMYGFKASATGKLTSTRMEAPFLQRVSVAALMTEVAWDDSNVSKRSRGIWYNNNSLILVLLTLLVKEMRQAQHVIYIARIDRLLCISTLCWSNNAAYPPCSNPFRVFQHHLPKWSMIAFMDQDPELSPCVAFQKWVCWNATICTSYL